MQRGLWVIDVQQGFIGAQTDGVVPHIRQALLDRLFPHVAFTRFVNSETSPHRRLLGWKKLIDVSEQEIDPRLKPFARTCFVKTVYSAVCESSLDWLQQNNILQLYLCGMDTDCCILKTAADLFETGLSVWVLADYCASNGGPESHQAALTVLERLIGRDRII
ncbi:cysteine hydrolase, partial [candidate division KSB1 bacterium]|nr:cysteine hydrolase [candidate division KSB1 bacterium]